jgi:hypothetical protein
MSNRYVPDSQARTDQRGITSGQRIFLIVTAGLFVFLALYNLADFPRTWYDEGSHLHVPKTLVRFGVYADYSSEGFDYYVPAMGVGPTVLLPIAFVFKLFGIGLVQARLVMVAYLIGTTLVFFRLVRDLGGSKLAWIATGLLLSCRGISFLEYGREVLGEVPGLFFLVVGLLLWFRAWNKPSWLRLLEVGGLFGLSMITRNQNSVTILIMLLLAWLANLVYYRTTRQRNFIVPALIAGFCFAAWQFAPILYLGWEKGSETLGLLRETAAGAAMILSPELVKRGLAQLLDLHVYLGMLVPALAYGILVSLARRREGQQWGILFLLIASNLAWYLFATVSWLRYAFLGLAFASLFVARLFSDLTDSFQFDAQAWLTNWRNRETIISRDSLHVAMLAWLGVMIVAPLGQTAYEIVFPPTNAPMVMTAYLDDHIPSGVLIETWEPELGFLTDHNYHFPPPSLLPKAVAFVWRNQAPPSDYYDFVQRTYPAYVLVGEFARWVKLYPMDVLASRYKLVTSIGGYELYVLNETKTQ